MLLNSRMFLAAICLTMTLSACATSNDPSMRPSLPLPPATFGLPVLVPQLVKGQDVRVLAARERAGLLNANQRLLNDKAFQIDVWTRFSKPSAAR